MTYLELLGLVLSGAGMFASILGVFFAVYAKQNGRVTRDLIATLHRETQDLLLKLDERAQTRHQEVLEAMKR